MMQPVWPWPYRFWRRKNGATLTLTYTWVIEWPLGPFRAVCCSLGCLRGLLCTLRENWGFSILLECEVSAQTCTSCMAIFLAARFKQFSSYRNDRWGDSSSILPFWINHGLRSDLRVPNFKNFLGKHAPRPPPWLVHTAIRPYQSKIAGSGPEHSIVVLH